MSNKLRYGIVGGGTIAAFHAEVAQTIPELELVAVCDSEDARAHAFAAQFGGPTPYSDRKKMFRECSLDLVSVCVPSGLHGEVVLDAAAAGVHSLCEKPLEITREKMEQMIAACDAAGVRLGVVHQLRTSPMWRKIAEVVHAGKLGKMVLGDAYLKYHRPQAYYDSAGWRGTWALDGGGCLMNQGVHYIDLLGWIMGPLHSVYARADHLVRQIEVEDTAVAVLSYQNGAFGVVSAATSVTPGVEARLEFHGECGSIRTEGDRIVAWHVPDVPLAAEFAGQDAHHSAADPTAISKEGHYLHLLDMCRAIREARAPMMEGREARKAVDVVLALYESARSGQAVNVEVAENRPFSRYPIAV